MKSQIELEIYDIPPDILRTIFDMLEDKDLIRLLDTSKFLHYKVLNDTFWLNRILNLVPLLPDEIKRYKKNNTYRAYYFKVKEGLAENPDALLVSSSRYNRADHVKIALRNGADIHRWYDASLLYSCSNGNMEIFTELINAGADIHTHDDYALQHACESGHHEIVEILVDMGCNIHTNNDNCIKSASERGYASVVKILLERGARVNANDQHPLRWAAMYGRTDVVRLLLENGADGTNAEAMTNASHRGHSDTLKLLIDHTLGRGGRIPPVCLELAVGRGHIKNIELLLEAGVPYNYKTILTSAAGRGDVIDLIKSFRSSKSGK